MTGINATKIIQNLEFVNSFGLSSLAFFLFWFFHFAIWVRCKPVGPRRGEGAERSHRTFASSMNPNFAHFCPALSCDRSAIRLVLRWVLIPHHLSKPDISAI